ncbi:MFS transporter [Paracoccus nototheniae]|uniref:MFS transporter n=1 Tax=Paracoccus nototheniae TaxID=2489002 RepID=A0ABW4DZR0_9RHOB|nr:MFS transporter [Paracoccus nototheniae]
MTRPGPSTANLVAVGFALTALAYGLARFAYGLLLPQIRTELGLGTVAAGWIGSVAFGAYCGGVVSAFVAVPRWGARIVAVAAGFCATAGLGLMGVAGSTSILGVAMGLAGISTGLASPPLAAAVGRHIPQAGRSRANGVINGGTAAGIMLSGIAALAFATAWRELYLGFAVIAAAVTFWLWQAIPSEESAKRSPGSFDMRPRGLLSLCFAAALMGAASTAIWTFGADILREQLHFSDQRIALAWLVLGTAGLVSVMTGAATDRFGIAAVNRLSLVLMGLGLVSLAAGSWASVLAFAAMGMFGAGYIVSCGALLLWGITLFPARSDLGIGLPFLMIAVGQMIGAPLFGALLEATGTTAALTGAALGMVCAAIPAPHRAGKNAGSHPEPERVA